MSEIPKLFILFQRLAIAMALGLLIGVEREREKAEAFAGIRTFPLISLMGCLTAMLNDHFVPWIFIVGFVILASIVLTTYIFAAYDSHGITTEITSLLGYLYGSLVWWQMTKLAAALTIITVLLLAIKKPLEHLTKQIAQQDIIAALQFGIITLIILPILPDQTFGPLNVLNPHSIWLMVVLIAGINFIGYLLIKILHSQQAISIAGLIGGIASSTAVTLGFSRRSKTQQDFGQEFAIGIILASTVMFIRVLVEAFTINPQVGQLLIAPIVIICVVAVVGCIFILLSKRKKQKNILSEKENVVVANPFELWSAIQFGLLFGLIIFITKAAQVFFGTTGIYLSSIITGMSDVDPITLSLSKLARENLNYTIAARGIIMAALSNTGVKGMITLTGSPKLYRYVLPIFGAMIAVGIIASFMLI